ncbi:phage terminase small subunit P27 family [Fructilactobacillus cliffordii]|uniref:phage terminase small subunit P27 family n=1 Tax=Fructilactobacillus cliffordii TaxID=2940299 RepID=UPI002093C363|nr:phage terminase small subunit P27 family [Fructilactobacillus cliffordii]USS86484.1 phage terminase small subunit P27 family [Fructilactobacillus cliffordii]
MPKNKLDLPDNPPDYLKGTARYMWRRIVPLIKKDPVVNNMDRTMVEAFCVNYQMMRDAYDHVRKKGAVTAAYKTVVNPLTGEVISEDFVGYKRNPSTQIIDSTTVKLKQLGSELGLTPQSRDELLKLKGNAKDSKDKGKAMAEFFGKKS